MEKLVPKKIANEARQTWNFCASRHVHFL